MTSERLQAIMQMIPAWKETDNYEEDFEKTAVIEGLVTELSALQTSSTTAVNTAYGIENQNGV
jgi:hypothetical protein